MAVIVFDLDGTLLDPLPGVLYGIRAACAAEGLTAPPEPVVASRIGFGMRGLFEELLDHPAPERLNAVMDRYWEAIREDGLYRHRLYEGIPLLLGRLGRQGHRLMVVTAKAAPYARQVLHHFDLYLRFEAIIAPGPRDADKPKAILMAEQCQDGCLQAGGLLIGDRGADMVAARALGLVPFGALWGFGGREELLNGGAERLFETVGDLDAFLLARFPEPETLSLTSRAE